jgi:hypothetical protein
MANKKKAPHVVRAAPRLKKGKKTDTNMVSVTRSQTATMQKSPDWASATAVQTSVASWKQGRRRDRGQRQVIAALLDQHKTAVAKQRVLRMQWSSAARQVVTDVNTCCDGAAEKVQGFGFDLATHTILAVLDAPANLVSSIGKQPGEAVITWDKGSANHGFLVQHATDVATPATYSGSIASTKPKYTISGATSGSVVHVRVAAIDPRSATGQSPWSAWIAATVR